MLRVALPNKGQLADPSREMLREAGYPAAHAARELVVLDPDNDVEAGTSFEALPDDWVCPMCGASKDDFSLSED